MEHFDHRLYKITAPARRSTIKLCVLSVYDWTSRMGRIRCSLSRLKSGLMRLPASHASFLPPTVFRRSLNHVILKTRNRAYPLSLRRGQEHWLRKSRRPKRLLLHEHVEEMTVRFQQQYLEAQQLCMQNASSTNDAARCSFVGSITSLETS